MILELRFGVGFVRAHLALVALGLLPELVERHERWIGHLQSRLLLHVDGVGWNLRLDFVLILAAVDLDLQHRRERHFLVVTVDQLVVGVAAGGTHDGCNVGV